MRMRSKRSTSHENGVIISIYVETLIIRTRDKNDPIKRINSKTKPNSLIFSKPPRTTALRSCGYDRRAQLLAYAQELRHANNSKLHQEGPIKKSFTPRKAKMVTVVVISSMVSSSKEAVEIRTYSNR
ncbi:Cytochrome P450 71A1 like [Actinidia chinensis var. chinensis]|uniref:Cytochrome P450 71A1 like n=1 Tax=Actinidia chinensis var. chinensis TaxID=1590841 RepID=A0A2R6S0J2_ACTCC|nr:Cytochrome P450 71A1 like [Actinidia chinensis var. chinensis]